MATRKEPKQTRSKRTVEFILRGAHKAILTSEKRVSTSSIARISGVGVGSVYQYFKNKEQVFYSLYRYLNKETYALVSDLGGDGYRDPTTKLTTPSIPWFRSF